LKIYFKRYQWSKKEIQTQLTDTNEKLRDTSISSGKVAVVAFVSPTILKEPKQMEIIAKLYDQFDKKDESIIVVNGLNWPQEKSTSFYELAEKYRMKASNKCFFFVDDKIHEQVFNGYQWPIKNNTDDGKRFAITATPQMPHDYPYFILVNKEREIINYYDFRDEARMKTMIEHVAISIPLEKRKKPKLKREQEK